MRRKISVFFILAIFLASLLSGVGINLIAKAEPSEFKSKSIYLADAYSKTVIKAENELMRAPIASMCKVMTLLLTFEAIDDGVISFDQDITVSENASGMGGSQVFLEDNAQYKVCELIKSITVASANDACVAIAEQISGSEEQFVDKMNEKATELGMENTCFTNCTGLPKAGQYSCAKDVFTMFSELIKHQEYFNYSTIWMDKVTHPKGRFTEISNTNKLIRFYEGCDSGKTGYTSEAGHCLTASAKRGDMRLVCVVISAPDSKTRFKEASSLFNYGFANFTNKLILDNNKPLEMTVNVSNGKKQTVKVGIESSIYKFSERNVKSSFELKFTPNAIVSAPIFKGQVLGKLSLYENGMEINCVNVIALEDIEKMSFFDRVCEVIDNWTLVG